LSSLELARFVVWSDPVGDFAFSLHINCQFPIHVQGTSQKAVFETMLGMHTIFAELLEENNRMVVFEAKLNCADN